MLNREVPKIELSEGRKILSVGVGGRWTFLTKSLAVWLRNQLDLLIPLMVEDGETLEQPDPAFSYVPVMPWPAWVAA